MIFLSGKFARYFKVLNSQNLQGTSKSLDRIFKIQMSKFPNSESVIIFLKVFNFGQAKVLFALPHFLGQSLFLSSSSKFKIFILSSKSF